MTLEEFRRKHKEAKAHEVIEVPPEVWGRNKQPNVVGMKFVNVLRELGFSNPEQAIEDAVPGPGMVWVDDESWTEEQAAKFWAGVAQVRKDGKY